MKPKYKPYVGRERDLQAACEKYLAVNCYLRLTSHNAKLVAAGARCNGWHGHLSHAKFNAFMPDLFIFNLTMTRSIMVELKVKNFYSPGQREFIDCGIWKQANSLDEFIDIFNAWLITEG